MVLGAGNIGSLISIILSRSKRYQVYVVDSNFDGLEAQKLLKILPELEIKVLDVTNQELLIEIMQKIKIHAVISCLPFFLNETIAVAAKAVHAHYFDLTEDVATTNKIKNLASQAKNAFVPQCGIAPGFINIITEHLMSFFDVCHDVKLRVGGLPKYIDNSLKYGLTWSLDGLINQYCNPCPAIEAGALVMKDALDDLEELMFDGCVYEAFNTSGGVGHLVHNSLGRVQHLNYKTIRYPGHCEKMRFLIKDLNLAEDRKTLYHILDKSLPRIEDDVLLLYASISGMRDNKFLEKHYFHKIFPAKIQGYHWTAMQTATASSACTAMDLILSTAEEINGFVPQSWFDFSQFVDNQFACCFKV